MDEQSPQSLRIVGVLQIIAGTLNLGLGWWLSSCAIGSVCGMLSLGFGGQFCGMLSCLLVPLGVIEVGVGIFVLLDPREAARFSKLVAFVEVGSVLLGGLSSLLVGIGALVLHQQDDVVLYLEG